METRNYWEENGHPIKYDNYSSNDGFGRAGEPLSFAAPSEDEAEYPPGAYLKKGKVSRQDPMSHRIIEKRRRDRMNNCLADLSRLIPADYLKKGRGRVEKTEIIEMAIRHLKFLQDRVNAAERQAGEEFRAGYQEAVAEAVRFLVEVQGFGPGDGLCEQLASHMQRYCDAVSKGDAMSRSDKTRSSNPGSSSETTSSSSSSHGFAVKVIQRPELPPAFPQESYEQERPMAGPQYPMECERVQNPTAPETESQELLPLDGRVKREALRKVRKIDHSDDYLHSYKFKNSIERRFSRSQDTEAANCAPHGAAHGKPAAHKRRRAAKPALPAPTPASITTSTSTEDARDTSPQDTSSESPHHHQYDKPPPPTQYVPVFALNSIGKYYVPLSVEYACIARQLGAMDSDSRPITALHPVTIHVNFPCLNYHVKREPAERQWRAI